MQLKLSREESDLFKKKMAESVQSILAMNFNIFCERVKSFEENDNNEVVVDIECKDAKKEQGTSEGVRETTVPGVWK